MRSKTGTRTVVVNSIVYSISGMLQKCSSLFLLPLYTAYLTTEDYGITSVARGFTRVMGFIVAFSLFSAVTRFYVDLMEEPQRLKRFYGTVSLFVFLSGLVFFLVLTFFRKTLIAYVFIGIDYYPIILVCLVALIFDCQYTIFDHILKSQQKAVKSSAVNIAAFFTTVALNIVFVVWFRLGALGTLLASMTTHILYTLYFVADLLSKHAIVFCLDIGLLKSALKYSIPIMPHNLSTGIASLISKILIGDRASFSGVGIYSIASQFGNFADTVNGYVSNAYSPWFYVKMYERGPGGIGDIRNAVKILSAVLGLFFVGISLFSQDYILLFIHKNYAEAWRYVPAVVLVYAAKTMYYFYVAVLFYYKEAAKFLFTATLSSSLFNIALSWLLIPGLGIYGSILADGISMVLRVAIVVAISRRFENTGLYVRDFIINFLTVTLFIASGLSLSFLKYGDTFNAVNFMFKIFVVFIYMLLIFLQHRALASHLVNVFKGRGAKR